MLSLDLFDSKFEKKLHEGAVDNLEARRIDDLNMRMLELLDRAKEPAYKKNPAALAGLKKQFQKIKAERDSYFKINPATGMDPTGSLGTTKGKLDEVDPPQRPPAKGLLKGKDLVTPQQRVSGATPAKPGVTGAVKDVAGGLKRWLKGEPDSGPTYEAQEGSSPRALGAANFQRLVKANMGNIPTVNFEFIRSEENFKLDQRGLDLISDYYDGLENDQAKNYFIYRVLPSGDETLKVLKQLGWTPARPVQQELPGMPTQGELPLQEKKKFKSNNDLQAGDVKVARELQKLRAQYPAARSDVEAVARAEIDSTERSQQQLSAIRGANEKQDALLKQLVALDQEQGREINSLDSELDRVQSVNNKLQQTLQSMTGTKKVSTTKTATPSGAIDLIPGAPADTKTIVATEPAPTPEPVAKPAASPAMAAMAKQIQGLANPAPSIRPAPGVKAANEPQAQAVAEHGGGIGPKQHWQSMMPEGQPQELINRYLAIDAETDVEAVRAAIQAISRDPGLGANSKSRLLGQIGMIIRRHRLPIGRSYYTYMQQYMEEQDIAETVTDVKSLWAQAYHKLAPKIERHRDSFLAGQLYDELENIAELHGAEGEFKRMMSTARGRAHMEYDTNPGGFQNWFWFLPFEDNMEEGIKSQLAGAALAGALALGAGSANARVTGDEDPGVNRLTGKPNVTQAVQGDQVKPSAPTGFSKEYLQSVVDGTHPRPMITKEKAQALLNQLKEQGVAEGTDDVKKRMSKLEALALDANRAGDDAKCKMYQQKIQSLKQKLSQSMAEGWSDQGNLTPYSVYIDGREWRAYKSDEHARAVADKVRANLKRQGRDQTVTIAPSKIKKVQEGQYNKLELASKEFIQGIYDPAGPVYRAAYRSFQKGQQAEAILRKHIAQKYRVREKDLIDAASNHVASRLAGTRYKKQQDMDEQLINENIRNTASATAVIACLLTGGSLSGCATAPQQTSAQQVLKTGQDIGRTVQTAKKITRAGVEAEVNQEIRNLLRGGVGAPQELNNSGILRVWRRLQGQPPVAPEPQTPEYGPADPVKRPAQFEAREIVSKEDFVRERDRLLRMIDQDTNPSNKQILKSTIRQLENRAENEGWITMQQRLVREDSNGGEAVEMAIMRRILVAHTDLIIEFGLDKVVQAIEEVAYDVGDTDEIGSSDVSGWVRQVKQILGADA